MQETVVAQTAKLSRVLRARAQGQTVAIVYLYIPATNVTYAKIQLTLEQPATSVQIRDSLVRLAINVLIPVLRGQIVHNVLTAGLKDEIVMNASTPNIPEISATNVQMSDSREQIAINA